MKSPFIQMAYRNIYVMLVSVVGDNIIQNPCLLFVVIKHVTCSLLLNFKNFTFVLVNSN